MKKIIKATAFALVVAFCFALATDFLSMTDREDTMHVRGYFEEPNNSIDVLMIGASELYTGFSSPLAWKKYGFTSYALSYSGAQGSLYKTMLTQALDTQNPKLVVFEVGGFLYYENYLKNYKKMHIWFDNVPDGETKLETLEQMIPAEKQNEYKYQLLKYHSNWKHPKNCFKGWLGKMALRLRGYSYTKAFATSAMCRKTAELEKYNPPMCDYSEQCLRELLEYCKSIGLKNVLFVRGPHCTDSKGHMKVYDKMEAMINEYGYVFRNYDNAFKEIGLDTKTNFYNRDHLNVLGMEKYTDFLGKYIVEHYDVTGYHSKEVIKEWDECVVKTEEVVQKCKDNIAEGKWARRYELSAFIPD